MSTSILKMSSNFFCGRSYSPQHQHSRQNARTPFTSEARFKCKHHNTRAHEHACMQVQSIGTSPNTGALDASFPMLAALSQKHNSPPLVRGVPLRKFPAAGVGSPIIFPRRPHLLSPRPCPAPVFSSPRPTPFPHCHRPFVLRHTASSRCTS